MEADQMRRIMEEIMDEGDGSRRDPRRIDVILEKLKEVWMLDTDMRFGQLVYNLFWQMQDTRKEGITGIDMFYVEDDIFEIRLDEVIREGWQTLKQ